MLLSGDVHFGELSCAALGGEGAEVIEATASGLSHAWGESEAVTPSQHTVDQVGGQENC